MDSSAPGRALGLAQRLVIAATDGPLRPLGVGFYRLVARLVGLVLSHGEVAGVYIRSGTSSPDLVPGISDIDLAVIVADDASDTPVAAERIRRRWRRLARRIPA